MKYFHYSNKFLTKMYNSKQLYHEHDNAFKPQGLWFTPDTEDGWAAWCTSNDFGLRMLTHTTQIILRDTANLLQLSTAAEIDAFTKKYEIKNPEMHFNMKINWPKVAKEYQGIIAAPYCWRRRMTPHTFWYYPWDCASGCIWDAKAVAKLKPIKGKSNE